MNPIRNNQDQEDEDNPDYDIFAAIRPKGISVDDNVSDEVDGEDVDEFAQARPKEEEIRKVQQERNRKRTVGETVKEVGQQAVKETLIGAGGTWGDLAELAGINQKVGEGQKIRQQRESDILDRMQQPGYKPTLADITELSSDADILPENFALPTSKGLRKGAEKLGAPGKPHTPFGKGAARTGRLYGSGVAFGQVNPLPALVAGIGGQVVEELGGGPIAQAITEIVSLIATPGGGIRAGLGKGAKQEVKQKINELRNLGYTDEEITLAINHASKGKKGIFKANKGAKTEQAFEDFGKKSDELVNDILTSSIPGIEQGTQHVHQVASDAYGLVAERARNIPITNSAPFIQSATSVVKEVRRNLGKNPDAEPFLNRLYDAVVDSTKSPSAENFMNFYKELNGLGKWMGRSQRDRLINEVKNGIKDTFKNEGKVGKQLAEDFEKVNTGVRKAYQAEEAHNLIQKATTQEGIDYTKLNKLFDKADNVDVLERALGTPQTNNLRQISKVGREVKDFDKAWKATHVLKGGTALDIARGAGIGYYLYKGDMGKVAAILATKGLGTSSKLIAEKMLTDPKFQNLMVRGLHALKSESPRSFRVANDALEEYLDKQGIKVKLD